MRNDLTHSTCLITGGTSGVGKATAIGLARQGARVILLSRSATHGWQTADELRNLTQNPDIHYRSVDLGDFDSIRTFCEIFKSEFDVLNILSNNAAVLPMQKEFTKNGIEKIFGINYLGHFLLTNLLLDFLKASAPARIITVSGDPAILRPGRINLNLIHGNGRYNPFLITYQTAVAKVAFSYELARRLNKTGVTSNTFHPGLVKTGLTRHLPGPIRIIADAAQIFFSDNCPTSVYLATSQELKNTTGKFFKNKTAFPYAPKYQYGQYACDLWDKSLKWTSLDQ